MDPDYDLGGILILVSFGQGTLGWLEGGTRKEAEFRHLGIGGGQGTGGLKLVGIVV